MSSSPPPTHDGNVARASVPGGATRLIPAATERASAFTPWMTAALIARAATVMLLGLDRLRPSVPVVMPTYTGWHGDYADVASWVAWTLDDTTEPGYAHSTPAGTMMLLGGYLAHRAFRSKRRWMGFPVASGTGLFGWAVGSAALGLALSNAAWGWTIALSGMWQPIVTGPVLGALIGPPGFGSTLTSSEEET